MSLFPFATDSEIALASNEVTASSIREYEIDFKTHQLTGRVVEGVDAIGVWANLAVRAERYKWVIYSWFHGEEFTSLLGKSYSEEYLQSEIQRYLEECLLENEHIKAVENLEVSQIKDKLYIKFKIITDVGSKEVEVDV